jgi:hypothetical protein
MNIFEFKKSAEFLLKEIETEKYAKKYTLIQAIEKISAKLLHGKTITAIQFEDGSGRRFNVRINDGPWQFYEL